MEAGTISQSAPARQGAITGGLARRFTETKASLKTSELWLTLAVIAGILISAAVINGGDTSGTDEFISRQAWLYVAIVTAAYVISRGLAKSGSSEPYTVDADGDDRGNSGR